MPGIRQVVGRETELAAIAEFLDAIPAASAGLLIEGEPGAGKSTVWSAALEAARIRSFTVLSCRCAEPEAGLSFNGLADTLESVIDDLLPELPPPQAHALMVALVRVDPGNTELDERAVLLGFLSALRRLAAVSPVLLAFDDVQWLDAATARTVGFACRRLRSEPVGILISARSAADGTRPAGLGFSLQGTRLTRLPIEPLPLAAIARILRDQAAAAFSGPLVRRIFETSGGNPLHALELARALKARGDEPVIDEPLPVPTGLRQLVQARLASLPPSARDVLLLAAAAPDPVIEMLAEAAGGEPVRSWLAPAIDLGVIEIRAGRVQFTHPLWASAAQDVSPAQERRRAHRRLAAVTRDPEVRVRHLALAAGQPSEEVAAALSDAAATVRARGATQEAAEYASLAARLTPAGERRWLRRIEESDYLFHAGDSVEAARLLDALIAELPRGTTRARARIVLGRIRTYDADNQAAMDILTAALDDAADEPLLQAEIQQTMAWICDFDLSAGLRHADAAVSLLEGAGQPAMLAGALGAKLWLEFLLGNGLRTNLAERATALERQAQPARAVDGIDLPLAALLKAADRLDEARAKFEGVLAAAGREQDDSSRFEVLLELGHLECLAGRWSLAEHYASEAAEFAELSGQEELRPVILALQALVDSLLGRLDQALAKAAGGLAIAEAMHATWLVLMNLPVLGSAELSAGRAAVAVAHLGRADEMCERIGLAEPGRFRFHADYVEALIGVGDLGRAGSVLDRFEERGRRLGRLWALATAARCRALQLAALGDQYGALEQLEIALRHHESLPMPLERARTLLVSGQVHRRAKHKRDARDALMAAESIFDSLGAVGWSARARQDLARIGLRPPSPRDLTETERGVAQLAADGLTNREIADRMFISLRTAESTLTRVYRKLGVRSRAELARDFGGHPLAHQRAGPS